MQRLGGFLAQLQHGHDYVVDMASTSAEVAAALRRGKPDLIMLDVQMTSLDGLSLLKQIRGLDRTIPVVVITGRQNTATVSQALSAGAFAYVPKPFEFLQIEHVVGLVFAARKITAS